MSNEFEANERVQKAEPLEMQKNEQQPLNLLDLASDEVTGRHGGYYPYPYPRPTPHPGSHVGGTTYEVHDGKIVVHRN